MAVRAVVCIQNTQAIARARAHCAGSLAGKAMEFESIFKKYDSDGNGKFDKTEFGHICYSLGCVPPRYTATAASRSHRQFFTPAELDAAFTLIDADGSGFIERDEFMHFWRTDNRFAKVRCVAPQAVSPVLPHR